MRLLVVALPLAVAAPSWAAETATPTAPTPPAPAQQKASPAPTQQKEEQPNAGIADQPQRDQGATTDRAAPLNPIQADTNPPKREENAQEGTKRDENGAQKISNIIKSVLSFLNQFSNFLIACLTAALMYVGTQQWRVSRRQAVVMEGQLKAAEDAANAAKASVDIARGTLVLTQRARLHCEMMLHRTRESKIGKEYSLQIIPKWRNYGQTTAKNVLVTSGMLISDREISPNARYEHAPNKIVLADIGAGMVMEGGNKIIEPEQLSQIRSKSLYAYVFAYAVYRSEFEELGERSTFVCRQILPDPADIAEFVAEVAGSFDRSD